MEWGIPGVDEFSIVGELEISNTGKAVYWRIPDFLSLPSFVDSVVDSPEFTFANATWCLQMYPHGQRLHETENFIDLQLRRRESRVEKHDGSLEFELNIVRPTEFGEDDDGVSAIERDVASFEDDDSSIEGDGQFSSCFHIEPNRRFHGETIVEYSRLLSHEDFVPPNDCVLVCCKLYVDGNAGIADVRQPVGSIIRDNQWFSVGDCDDNPTVGTIKDRDLKRVVWSIPSIYSICKHTRIQSPHFFAGDATWCLRILYLEEYEDAIVAVARLHTVGSNPPKQELSAEFHVETRFRKKCKTLQEAEGSCVVERNELEHEMFAFECSQKMIKRAYALAVSCVMKLSTIAADDDQSEEVFAESVKSVSKLLGDFERLLQTSEGSDVNLLVKGQNFAAHSAVLRARSSVFNSMLNSDMKEKRTGTVDIEDCDPGTFSDFLRFLYCGRVEDLSSDNVFSLYRAADKYDVQDLKSPCVSFMQRSLTEETFCDIVALSLQHGENELLKLATEFFAKNYQRIILSDKWQQFIVENPTESNELFIEVLVPDKASKEAAN